jgi:tetratricopeptide (TPR) repeat protein
VRPLLAALLLAAVPLAGSAAQTPPPPPRPMPPVADEVFRGAGENAPVRGQETYSLAVRLLGSGQTAEATAILEDLLLADPASVPVWLKLKEAYVAARRFDDAIGLIEAFQDQQGPSVDLAAERGVLLYQSGKADDARAAWDAALALGPRAEQTYRVVATALAEIRLYDEAAAVLDRGREALGADDAFLLERAHLHSMANNYTDAIEAYLRVLARPGQTAAGVISRLGRLVENEGAAEVFSDAVARAITRDPLNRPYRDLQAWLAMERKDYDAALDATRAIDRLEREQGQSLVAFANAAQSAGALDAAARALDEVMARHGSGPYASFALFARAALADQRAREAAENPERGPAPEADIARASYREFLTRFGPLPEAPRTALAWAALERDLFRNYAAADSLLTIAAVSRDPNVAGEAQLALGEVAIRRGDLDTARERFVGVEDALRIGALAEQARFEQALLDFYEGFALSALARVEAMDDNTAADVSNDAIMLRVTLNENAGPDSTSSALRGYATARLLHRRVLLDAALASVDSLLTELAAHEIGDELLFLRAQVLRDLGRPAEAVAALDLLAERHVDSFFRDRALLMQAEMLERALGDTSGASARYEQLLIDFPGSLFVPLARQNLQRLRTPS